jgi:RNA polymerase sigma-70 factor (ECF subfamily)
MSHHRHPQDWLKEIHKESYLWSLCCCGYNEEMAKDVLQDAYLKVIEKKARNSSSFYRKTWFFSVIKFTAIDALRVRKPTRVPVHEAHNIVDGSGSDELMADERVKFKEILSTLSKHQREILTLVFYNDLSIHSAANVLNMKVGTARTHYKRGKENFKKQLIRMQTNMIN